MDTCRAAAATTVGSRSTSRLPVTSISQRACDVRLLAPGKATAGCGATQFQPGTVFDDYADVDSVAAQRGGVMPRHGDVGDR
jgi:hypothetical protein